MTTELAARTQAILCPIMIVSPGRRTVPERGRIWQDLSGFGAVFGTIPKILYVLQSWVTSYGTGADR